MAARSAEMVFVSEKQTHELFDARPATAERDAAEGQVRGDDEIDDTSTLHVPPDGGLHAWLKVLGCFLMYSNIW